MNQSELKKSLFHVTLCAVMAFALASCGWIRASGDAVESVGDGAAHAVEETGDAVGRAASETEDEIDDLG